ncbi:hypothetical protein [Thalassobacillus sp. B23F22_16]|uniref:hypothetical protein n=1 Tax=Thalassobacillus sp. B23F22_16 TaxID=3459513 RepID=UPI00373EA61F
MKELTSYQIHLNQSVTTTEIIDIHKYVAKSDCEIYLHQGQLIADASIMPKLMSFFLLANTKKPIKMIIDGNNAEKAHEKIEQILSKQIKQSDQRVKYSGSMAEQNISIVV